MKELWTSVDQKLVLKSIYPDFVSPEELQKNRAPQMVVDFLLDAGIDLRSCAFYFVENYMENCRITKLLKR